MERGISAPGALWPHPAPTDLSSRSKPTSTVPSDAPICLALGKTVLVDNLHLLQKSRLTRVTSSFNVGRQTHTWTLVSPTLSTRFKTELISCSS